MDEQPLYTTSRSGLSVSLYADRLEVTRGSLWQRRRTQVIPLADVTSVTLEGLRKARVRIIGTGLRGLNESLIVGPKARELRDAIIAAMVGE